MPSFLLLKVPNSQGGGAWVLSLSHRPSTKQPFGHDGGGRDAAALQTQVGPLQSAYSHRMQRWDRQNFKQICGAWREGMTRDARHRRIREGDMSGSDLAPAGKFRSDPAMERLFHLPSFLP